MNATSTIAPDFAATASWSTRLELFRGSFWQQACLASIRDEARRADCLDWYWAAQTGIDTLGDLTELDELIAQEAESERLGNAIRWHEVRTGKLWDGWAL